MKTYKETHKKEIGLFMKEGEDADIREDLSDAITEILISSAKGEIGLADFTQDIQQILDIAKDIMKDFDKYQRENNK